MTTTPKLGYSPSWVPPTLAKLVSLVQISESWFVEGQRIPHLAQITLDGSQIALVDTPPSAVVVWAEAALWNGGVAMTVIGTYREQPLITTLAAVPTIAAIVLFVAAGSGRHRHRRLQVVHRTFAMMIAVSVPIGVRLAWSRHG